MERVYARFLSMVRLGSSTRIVGPFLSILDGPNPLYLLSSVTLFSFLSAGREVLWNFPQPFPLHNISSLTHENLWNPHRSL